MPCCVVESRRLCDGLHLLDDDEFIEAIFGDMRGLRSLSNLCDDEKDKFFSR